MSGGLFTYLFIGELWLLLGLSHTKRLEANNLGIAVIASTLFVLLWPALVIRAMSYGHKA